MNHAHLRRRGVAAAAGLALGHLAVTTLLLWGTFGARDAVRAPGPATADAAVALLAAAAAWLVLTWLTLATLGAVLTAAVSGLDSAAHRRALHLAPAAARRLAGALLGLTLVSAPVVAAVPATATEVVASVAATVGLPGTDRPVPDPDRPAAGAPDGWTPDRPAAPHRRRPGSESAVRLVAAVPDAEKAVADEVVVRRGDTLWAIAAGRLGPDASAAEVATEWPRWYAANLMVIGADPDLLLPGQRLVPPGH